MEERLLPLLQMIIKRGRDLRIVGDGASEDVSKTKEGPHFSHGCRVHQVLHSFARLISDLDIYRDY